MTSNHSGGFESEQGPSIRDLKKRIIKALLRNYENKKEVVLLNLLMEKEGISAASIVELEKDAVKATLKLEGKLEDDENTEEEKDINT